MPRNKIFCSCGAIAVLWQGTLIETWMLLEYADRGSLEQAISTGRFLKRGTRTVDMVSHAHDPQPTVRLCWKCICRPLWLSDAIARVSIDSPYQDVKCPLSLALHAFQSAL